MNTFPAPCYLLQEAAASGSWNMAMDEWLLQQALTQGQLTLRFYAWSEPTLSLGFFQERSLASFPQTLQQLPKVRRLTGGGAILHDQELTYSLAVPAEHPLASTPVDLYGLIHTCFITALQQQGVQAAMRGSDQTELNGSFLCFLRGDKHDVMIGSHKILGSAQRRRKGAILQHGSLLLKTSSFAASVPGIAELTGFSLHVPTLIDQLLTQLGSLSPCTAVIPPLSDHQLQQIQSLEARYLNWPD